MDMGVSLLVSGPTQLEDTHWTSKLSKPILKPCFGNVSIQNLPGQLLSSRSITVVSLFIDLIDLYPAPSISCDAARRASWGKEFHKEEHSQWLLPHD